MTPEQQEQMRRLDLEQQYSNERYEYHTQPLSDIEQMPDRLHPRVDPDTGAVEPGKLLPRTRTYVNAYTDWGLDRQIKANTSNPILTEAEGRAGGAKADAEHSRPQSQIARAVHCDTPDQTNRTESNANVSEME